MADSGRVHDHRPAHGHASHGHEHDGRDPQAAQGAQPAASLSALTTAATWHCLAGCALGELAGLIIGVEMGLGPWATMGLATILGFAGGFAFALRPLMRAGIALAAAWRAIWLGETISIAVMELAMNATDYSVGGVTAGSVLSPVFWLGYAAAIVAGFIAAWPVNYWMLKANLKRPHRH